jgi:hypothetical protein
VPFGAPTHAGFWGTLASDPDARSGLPPRVACVGQDTSGEIGESPPSRDPVGRLGFRLLLRMGLFLVFLTVVIVISAIRGGPGSSDSTDAIFPAVLMTFAVWLVLIVIWRARRNGPPVDRPLPAPPSSSTTDTPTMPAGPPTAGTSPPPSHWPCITYDGHVRGDRRVLLHSRQPGQLRIEQEALIMGNRRTAYRYGRDRIRELHLSPRGILSITFVDGRRASLQFAQTRQIDPQPDMADALRNRGWPVIDERLPIARL